MEKRRIAKVLGVLLSAVFIISLASASFAADDFKKFGARIRGVYVLPDERFDGALKGAGLKVEDALAPELDFEYFFTKHISAELVLALTKHDIMTQSNNNVVGSLWLLPPSLLVKYHFMPDCIIDPYVGAGMNVVVPFAEKLNADPSFKVDATVGWAAQVGVDVPVAKNVYFNVDAKYYNTQTTMRVGGAKLNLDINPFILGTGIGVRF